MIQQRSDKQFIALGDMLFSDAKGTDIDLFYGAIHYQSPLIARCDGSREFKDLIPS
jgi:hypothetical protein